MGTHLRPPPGPWSPGRPASSTRQLPKTATLLLTMRRDNTCTREQARSRGARPVGRPGTGTFLAAYCKRHTGAERRYVGGYSIWIHGSATRETKRASFLKVGLFRSCAPDRPNLEKRRVKAGPTQISKQISRNLGLGQGGGDKHVRPLRAGTYWYAWLVCGPDAGFELGGVHPVERELLMLP